METEVTTVMPHAPTHDTKNAMSERDDGIPTCK